MSRFVQAQAAALAAEGMPASGYPYAPDASAMGYSAAPYGMPSHMPYEQYPGMGMGMGMGMGAPASLYSEVTFLREQLREAQGKLARKEALFEDREAAYESLYHRYESLKAAKAEDEKALLEQYKAEVQEQQAIFDSAVAQLTADKKEAEARFQRELQTPTSGRNQSRLVEDLRMHLDSATKTARVQKQEYENALLELDASEEATRAVRAELKLVQERRNAMMMLVDCLSAMLGAHVFLDEERQVIKCTFENYTDGRSYTCEMSNVDADTWCFHPIKLRGISRKCLIPILTGGALDMSLVDLPIAVNHILQLMHGDLQVLEQQAAMVKEMAQRQRMSAGLGMGSDANLSLMGAGAGGQGGQQQYFGADGAGWQAGYGLQRSAAQGGYGQSEYLGQGIVPPQQQQPLPQQQQLQPVKEKEEKKRKKKK
jgi:hypothetical protein